jgi:hypothetical protein
MPLRQEFEQDDLKCHGCGIELQYDEKDRLGFISKLKVVQHFQRQDELSQTGNVIDDLFDKSQFNQKSKQKDLIKHLKGMNAPEDVI